jgi:membrane associated rhomboid family serine protease
LPSFIVIGRLRIPFVIASLLVALTVVSIAAAVTARNGAPALLNGAILTVPGVWRGQVWRLVTYPLLTLEPLTLIVSCLMLYWFGGDLAGRWGARRFLGVYFGLAAAAGLITCLIGLVWREVAVWPHAGSSPVINGLIVVWGLLHRGREIRLYGLFRLTGRTLVWITFGGTVLYALFDGFAPFVPHFAAELLALAWLMLPRRRRGAPRASAAEAWSFQDWYDRQKKRR